MGADVCGPMHDKWTNKSFTVFGTDPDRNRALEETPVVELIPFHRKPLGIRAPYATRRKLRYEANKCG